MNKTFKDLEKGDIIYSVCVDLPRLTIVRLVVENVIHESNFNNRYLFSREGEENHVFSRRIYLDSSYYSKDGTTYRFDYLYWHTTVDAARNTIKETIKYRIKKKQEIIRESKRAIENYKQQLKEYENII